MKTSDKISFRRSAVAGRFFPANPEVLLSEVEAGISEGHAGWRPNGSTPQAVISPHAGYRFSGWLTGAAWRATARVRRERIVILSPSHQHAFDGIALPSQGGYAMPGFDVAVDEAARAELLMARLAHVDDAAHDREHGIETQLGFLNRLHPGAKVVPLIIGRASVEDVAKLIDHLAGLQPDPLFVLSSDLSHFLTLEKAERHDLETARLIETGRYAEITPYHACGARAVAGYMASATGAGLKVQRLAMASSHAVNGDAERTVGYGAWAFFDPLSEVLLPVHREELLRTARQALTSRIRKGQMPQVNVSSFATPLQGHGAAFVTLQKGGQLRGCIGSLKAHRPLVQDVAENVVKSGFNDPRFRPLEEPELAEIDIKIAVLSPARRMRFEDEADVLERLEPGRDGLVLSDGARRGTFLPMVWESLPEPRDFLEGLKIKAGLAKEHWSDTLRIDRFRAESFSEADEGKPAS